jgi:zinc/manganese transport system permease protein
MTWPPFLLYALLAGTAIAAAVGLVGYFVVLRAQVFTGDALSHVAFTGTMAALAGGLAPLLGLFGSTVLVGVGIGLLGGSARARDVVIGTVFAWVLGLGVLFLSIYTSTRSAGNGTVGVGILFGSIYGLTGQKALVALLVGVALAVVLAAMGRPLLFASVDADVAAARGVPVRLLAMLFPALVGVTVAEAVQAVGALLALGLLVTPAAAVHRLCARPLAAFWLSAATTVGCLWLALVLSYAVQALPPSFLAIAVAFVVYLGAVAFRGRPGLVHGGQGHGLHRLLRRPRRAA